LQASLNGTTNIKREKQLLGEIDSRTEILKIFHHFLFNTNHYHFVIPNGMQVLRCFKAFISTKMEAEISNREKRNDMFLNLFFYQIGSRNQQ